MTKKTQLSPLEEEISLSITGRNIELTKGIKEHICDKFRKLDRLAIGLFSIEVRVDVQKKIHHHVVVFLHCRDFKIQAEDLSSDLYVSIDHCVQKLQKQLRKYRDKIKRQKTHPHFPLAVSVFAPIREEDEEEEEEEQGKGGELYDDPTHKLIGEEEIQVRLLTTEEAIIKMELSGDPFMIFRSEEEQTLKIIYRREDGKYVIVKPK